MSEQAIRNIIKKLEQARQHYGVGVLSERVDAKAANTMIDDLAKLADRFSAFVTPPPGARYPTLKERIVTLTEALERIANRSGALNVPPDTLLALVVESCPTPDAAQFWAKESPDQLRGLVQHKDLAQELATRGVLVWAPHNHESVAALKVRLVDTAWLGSHAAIFEFVTNDAPPGGRCRFCRLPERHGSALLKSVDTPAAGLNAPKLTVPDQVQTHPQCESFWLQWIAIARQYANVVEAQAADVAAGRRQDAMLALPIIPEEPKPEPLEKHE